MAHPAQSSRQSWGRVLGLSSRGISITAQRFCDVTSLYFALDGSKLRPIQVPSPAFLLMSFDTAGCHELAHGYHDALALVRPFADKILKKQKTWELRNRPTNIRGSIGLMEVENSLSCTSLATNGRKGKWRADFRLEDKQDALGEAGIPHRASSTDCQQVSWHWPRLELCELDGPTRLLWLLLALKAGVLQPEWAAALRSGKAPRSSGDGSVGPGSGPLRFDLIGGPSEGESELMLYLSDIDFTGTVPAVQFPSLVDSFEPLWRCTLPAEDRKTGFAELAQAVEEWLRQQVAEGRRVVLLGDGFGGLLALAVALQLGRALKGLVLVNPATGLVQKPWQSLGGALPVKPLAELLQGAPAVGGQASFEHGLGDLIVKAATSAAGFRSAALAARSGTLDFRLRAWLRDGWEAVSCDLRRPASRTSLPATLLTFSKDDALLPSSSEAGELRGLLAERCLTGRLQLKELESRSHEPLASDIDFATIVKESPIFAYKDPVTGYEFPSLEELEEGSKGVERIASVVSPVFCSFDASSPSLRSFGLGGVPTPAEAGDRPVLLVGNHQIGGLDLGPLVREFLVTRGVVARGLAYPGAMRRMTTERGPSQFQTFGAVPVSPRNIFKLLQQGEMVLLFPGGVREALHGPGEAYKLFWPSKTDFVRVAARFDALVVPFAGVGADDNVQVLANSRELRSKAEELLPFMARSQPKSGGLMPVSESLEAGMSVPFMAPPLSLATQSSPGIGDRFYFSFGKPVDLKDVSPKDKSACKKAYASIRKAVEQELEWLQQARLEDPFRDLLRRQLFERVASIEPSMRRIPEGPLEGQVVRTYANRAPSFPVEDLPPPQSDFVCDEDEVGSSKLVGRADLVDCFLLGRRVKDRWVMKRHLKSLTHTFKKHRCRPEDVRKIGYTTC
ncbi:unnamed protein product [Symbiodinium necroappetens]|uniref:Phospholipid/glycerol acyltransferase domain-containing protein n=1 Tax=Symbiodinium necroappetens TaxID=1628268 RepID=A0A812MCF3_9DINO|nr:unnamed protein product [Symbiodinium necroappetens]